MAREFFKAVSKRGRNSEGEVTLRMYLKAGPWHHWRKAALGLRLYLKGRLRLAPDRIRDRHQLRDVLAGLERSFSGAAQPNRVGQGV